MITNKNLTISKSQDMKSIGKTQQQRMDDDCQNNIEDKDDGNKDDNSIF